MNNELNDSLRRSLENGMVNMPVPEEARIDLLRKLEAYTQFLQSLKDSSSAREACVASKKLQADLQAFINRVCRASP